MDRDGDHHWWRASDVPEILPAGDVVLREPREGWSPGFYEAVLQQYFMVSGSYPRTARMHPRTGLRVAPAVGVLPVWWPIPEVRRHSAPTRIILSDDAPQLPEAGEDGGVGNGSDGVPGV